VYVGRSVGVHNVKLIIVIRSKNEIETILMHSNANYSQTILIEPTNFEHLHAILCAQIESL
jgi:hypothetical protein